MLIGSPAVRSSSRKLSRKLLLGAVRSMPRAVSPFAAWKMIPRSKSVIRSPEACPVGSLLAGSSRLIVEAIGGPSSRSRIRAMRLWICQATASASQMSLSRSSVEKLACSGGMTRTPEARSGSAVMKRNSSGL